jgi:hypothetical protein
MENLSTQTAAPISNGTSALDMSWDNIQDTAPKLESVSAPIEGDVTPKKENILDKELTKNEENKESEKDQKDPAEVKPSFDDSSEIEMKIDGEMKKVSLKDLKAEYSGKFATQKRFSEIDKERKIVLKEKATLQSEIQNINQYVDTFAKKIQAKDSLGALQYLSQFSGMSPAAVKQNLIMQLLPEIDRLSTLSPEARDLEVSREEILYQKARQEQELNKIRSQTSQKEAELQNVKVKAQNGISDEEWDASFGFLDQNLPKDKPITRQDVVDYTKWKRADQKCESALSGFESGKYLSDKIVRDTLNKVIRDNPDFTDSDINGILMDTFKGKIQEQVKKTAEVKNVSNKARDERGRFTYTDQPLTSWD